MASQNNQMTGYYNDGRPVADQTRNTNSQVPMQNLHPGGPRGTNVDHRQYGEEIRKVDTNNDGYANRPVIDGRQQGYQNHQPVKPQPPKKILTEEEQLFHQADRNGDGYIDFGEYMAAKERGEIGGLKKSAPFPHPSRREFNRADTNKDGNIDWDEFIAARKRGLLGGKVTFEEYLDDPMDSTIWSVIGLLLAAIMFFVLGAELNDNNANYSLSRDLGWTCAIGFCIYLIGILVNARGEWCSTPYEDRGCDYFATLLLIAGGVGLATVMWGLALGFTMNGGERYLVETCAYIMAISCFFIAIARVIDTRSKVCTQVIAWFAFSIMCIIGLCFIVFGNFFGDGEEHYGTYSVFCHLIGALLLIYIIILIIDMCQLAGYKPTDPSVPRHESKENERGKLSTLDNFGVKCLPPDYSYTL